MKDFLEVSHFKSEVFPNYISFYSGTFLSGHFLFFNKEAIPSGIQIQANSFIRHSELYTHNKVKKLNESYPNKNLQNTIFQRFNFILKLDYFKAFVSFLCENQSYFIQTGLSNSSYLQFCFQLHIQLNRLYFWLRFSTGDYCGVLQRFWNL